MEPRRLLSTLPAGFAESLVAGGLNPASEDFAPDGRLFVAHKNGSVRIIQNDNLLPTPFWSVAVDTFSDRGLTAIAVDPKFSQNHFVYVEYTAAVPSNPNVAGNGAITRLVRLTASASDPNVADPNSVVVLVDGIPSPTGQHTGGFLHFAADGMLYFGVGYGDAPNSAQDLSNTSGKILRLDVHSYPNIIPPDNPFIGQSGALGSIWAYGFRNPFSGNIDPVTDQILVNDVGSDKWEEVDQLVRGGNYGWPLAEGTSTNSAFINPLYTYSHNGSGAAATGGVFYHGTSFPTVYQNNYFVADVAQNTIRYIHPDDGDPFVFATNVPNPSDLDVGPDGSIYYTSVTPGVAGVFKIAYLGGNNLQPTAVISSDVTDGLTPLSVNFSGAQSTNPSGYPLTYSWDFGDGTTGSGVAVAHTYTTKNTYSVGLTVTDTGPGGLSSKALPVKITAGNRSPSPVINTPLSTDKYTAGQTITFTGSATDPDDGTLPASAYHWSFLFGHNTHFHDFVAPIDGVTSGSFAIPQTGETDPDQYYRIFLTVTDSGGLSKTVYTDIRPQLSNFTLATNIPGLTVNLDAQPQVTPTTITGVVGMKRTLDAPFTQVLNGKTYVFDTWSDGGIPTHSIATPAANTTFTANYHEMSSALVASLAGTLPVNWLPGKSQTYTVTVTNNGTETWQAAGANPTHLAVYFDGTSDAVKAWTAEPVRFNLPQDVAPGQSATITATISAPATPGQYVLRNRMVKENVAWFDQLLKASIYDGNLLATYAATPAPYWAAGFSSKFDITITNNSNQTWNATGTNPVKLGVYFDAASDLPNSWTTEPIRFVLPNDLLPGQSTVLTVSMATPAAAGVHVLRYRMVKEGVAWSDQFGKATVTSGTLAGQVNGAVPTVWKSGETKTFPVTLTNTGTLPWPAQSVTPVHLAAYFDASSDAVGAWSTEPTRFTLANDLAPGQSEDVLVTMTAPTAAGDHVLRHRLVMENISWFTQPLVTNVSVGTLAAAYAASPPTVWELGSTKTYQVTVTNMGTVTWLAGGSMPVHLAAYFDATSDAPNTWTTEPVRFNLPNDVAPGQSATVTVTATAPNTVGSFILRTRLVKETTTWFDQLLKTPITQPALAATYTSSPPTTWFNIQSQTYTVTVTNVGTQTWNAAGTNPVHLGVYFGGASDAIGAAGWSTEPKRFNLPADVAPGQSATLTVTMNTPANGGSYVLRNRLVKENVNWFSSMQKTNVTVNTLSATYSASPPTTWNPGQSRTFAVTVTNTGNVTWNAGGTNPIRLGVYFGGVSDAVGAWTAEPKRVLLPADLPPGASVTLNVTMTAPSAPGTYVLRERMVKEQIGWFSDMLRTNVTVGATVAPLTSSATSSTASTNPDPISTVPPTVYWASVSGTAPSSVAAGSTLGIELRLTNLGSEIWKSAGPSRVKVVVYLDPMSLSASRTTAWSTSLSSDIASGSSFTISPLISIPKKKGGYILRVRLVGDDGAVSDYVLQSNITIR